MVEKNSRIISLGLTVFLLALIILSAPILGINVSISNLAGSYLKGTNINFQATVEITSPEHLPINYANITFTFPDSSMHVCQVYLNQTVDGCNFLTVNSIDFDSLTYGYGYGYGYDNGYGYSLGYGYGYSGNGNITFNFTLYTSGLSPGNYNAKVEVYAGVQPNTHTFKSSTVNFDIKMPPTSEYYTSRSGISPSYVISIIEADTNIIQTEKTTYSVRVKNEGNVYLERVYLVLSLPEDSYTTRDPISLEPEEEGILTYSISLPPGNYPFTLTVIGEIGEKQTEDRKEVFISVPSTGETRQNETGESTGPTQETLSPRGITGLIVGVRNLAVNYWFVLAALILISLGVFFWKPKILGFKGK